MRKLFILMFLFFSLGELQAQVKGYEVWSTSRLKADHDFIWAGDTIRKDSLVYAEMRNDSIRFQRIGGEFTGWFFNGDYVDSLLTGKVDTVDAYKYWRLSHGDPLFSEVFGALYDYNCIAGDTLAPAGWHVPTLSEWQTLVSYLGGTGVAGGKLKEADYIHWNSPNTGATNESLFRAMGAGYCAKSDSVFYNEMQNAYFWTSSYVTDYNVPVVKLSSTNDNIEYIEAYILDRYSIRYIKNNDTDTGTMTDNDGNIYPTVTIGAQVWMAANLKDTSYRTSGKPAKVEGK